MKELQGAFNQEKALFGAFIVIVKHQTSRSFDSSYCKHSVSENDHEHCFQNRIIDVLAGAIIVGGLAYLVSNGMLLYNWVTSADAVQIFDRM